MNPMLKVLLQGGSCGLMLGLVLLCGRAYRLPVAHAEGENPPAKAETLRVSQLELVDADGKVRARLDADEGTASIIFFDAEGTNRAQFGLDEDGSPLMIFSDSEDISRLQVAVDEKGTPGFMLCDDKGNSRAELSLTSTGLPGLLLQDPKEKTRASFFLDKEQTPNLEYYDDKGTLRFGSWLLANQMPEMVMYDAAGKTRSYMGLSKEGNFGMGLANAQEKLRASFGLTSTGAPQLSYYDTAELLRGRFGLENNEPELSLRNSKGEEVTTYSVTEKNVPCLAMGNDSKHLTMQMLVTPEGFSELEMRDQQGNVRSLMATYADGNSVFSLSDATDPRVWLRMKNGTPLIGVTNTDGDFIWSAP